MQNKSSEFCAPLTSFDWNEKYPNIIGTASIDTTCTIWDVTVRGRLDGAPRILCSLSGPAGGEPCRSVSLPVVAIGFLLPCPVAVFAAVGVVGTAVAAVGDVVLDAAPKIMLRPT